MPKNGTAYVFMDEQETVIRFGRTEDYAIVSTSDTTMKTKFNKLVEKSPDHWKLISEDEIFSTYRCTPKSLISYRQKIIQRTLTDEQRSHLEEIRSARSKITSDGQSTE